MASPLSQKLLSFQELNNYKIPATLSRLVQPLALIGGLWAANRLLSITSFIWLHFLRPSSLSRYKSSHGETWALVTGSSDGIGKGFAQELASRGFNVIVHGRNETKLRGVLKDLQQQYPAHQFRLMILDAEEGARDSSKIATALQDLKDLNIRVLINNVAGGGSQERPWFSTLHERTEENVNGWLDLCIRFQVHLTRLILPQLIKTQPSLIINIGSGSSEMPVPYMQNYAASKAFNNVWTKALNGEFRAEGNKIEVFAAIVGTVATEKSGRATSFTMPSSRRMAQSTLNKVGSGHLAIFTHWTHALQFVMFIILPSFFLNGFVDKVVKQMRAEEAVEMKRKA